MKDFSPPSKKAAPETLAALYRRLTDPAAEPWATTDVDGRLLTARDAERLGELLKLNSRSYRVARYKERLVLVSRYGEKTLVGAWLEENETNSRRPIARFIVKPRFPAAAPESSDEE